MDNHRYNILDLVEDEIIFTGNHKECVSKYNDLKKLDEVRFYSIDLLLGNDILNKEEEALYRYNNGEILNVSTFIDEDTIIAGYGNLDYDFEFPLPASKIREIYGTNSWNKYFKNVETNENFNNNNI